MLVGFFELPIVFVTLGTQKSEAKVHCVMALIPVRCFTCRQVTGNKWDAYVARLKEGQTSDQALDALKVKAPCCRRMLFTHMDTSERLLRYQALETENMKASMQATAGGVDDLDGSGGEDG